MLATIYLQYKFTITFNTFVYNQNHSHSKNRKNRKNHRTQNIRSNERRIGVHARRVHVHVHHYKDDGREDPWTLLRLTLTNPRYAKDKDKHHSYTSDGHKIDEPQISQR